MSTNDEQKPTDPTKVAITFIICVSVVIALAIVCPTLVRIFG